MSDRRRHERVPAEWTSWKEMRLRTGDPLTLVNIGSGGALVDSRRRLLPGTAVFVHLLSTAAPVLGVRALVVRCYVTSLDAQHGVQYRGALSFSDEVHVGGTVPG